MSCLGHGVFAATHQWLSAFVVLMLYSFSKVHVEYIPSQSFLIATHVLITNIHHAYFDLSFSLNCLEHSFLQ